MTVALAIWVLAMPSWKNLLINNRNQFKNTHNLLVWFLSIIFICLRFDSTDTILLLKNYIPCFSFTLKHEFSI